jgi:hypothetical protein
MAKSHSAQSRSSEVAPHEKAARRVKQLKSRLRVQNALLSLLFLAITPLALPWVYFEAKEKIADFWASDEQIQDRVRADTDALLYNSLRLVGVPAASFPMAHDVYIGLLVLSVLGSGWLGVQRHSTQRAFRDQEAEYALLALRAGARPPRLVGCFLRSFRFDDIFGAKELTLTEQAQQGRRGGRRRAAGVSLEQRLSFAFAGLPESPIVCSVGRHKAGSAFGRIETSDSDWKAVVSTLVTEADFFVLIFGLSAGTSWELDELAKHHLIDRTLFILPSKEMLKSQSAMDAYEIERGYKQLFSALSKIGYTPPAYEEGSAFCFRDKQAVSIYSNNKIRKRAISSFVAGLPPRRVVSSLHE